MNDKPAWAKCIVGALVIHLLVLILPVSYKQGRDVPEQTIEVTLMEPRGSGPALHSGANSLPPGPIPRPGPKTTRNATRVSETERTAVAESQKGAEGKGTPASAGNILEKEKTSQLPPAVDKGDDQGVAVAGVDGGSGSGYGTGGTGTGSGKGGAGGGSGGGTSGAGSGGGGTGGGGTGGLAGFGKADGPQFLHRALPEYPPVAKKRGKEGKAVILVSIDEKGKLTKADVVEATDQTFAHSAIDALYRSTFLPAKKKGVPIACRALLPVRFSIHE